MSDEYVNVGDGQTGITIFPKKPAYRCSSPPPNRVWTQTEDGWTSREWERGERLAYEREVLGR